MPDVGSLTKNICYQHAKPDWIRAIRKNKQKYILCFLYKTYCNSLKNMIFPHRSKILRVIYKKKKTKLKTLDQCQRECSWKLLESFGSSLKQRREPASLFSDLKFIFSLLSEVRHQLQYYLGHTILFSSSYHFSSLAGHLDWDISSCLDC